MNSAYHIYNRAEHDARFEFKLHVILSLIFIAGVTFMLLSGCGDGSATIDSKGDQVDDLPENGQGLFTQIQPKDSKIDFVNELTENADFNYLRDHYYYNGGGVAIGDLNND